jgi:hypothetical protein
MRFLRRMRSAVRGLGGWGVGDFAGAVVCEFGLHGCAVGSSEVCGVGGGGIAEERRDLGAGG